MSEAWDDVNCECNQQGSNRGIDGPEKRKRNRKEPDGQHHRDTANGSEQQTLCVVYANKLLPHEVEGCDCKSYSDELHPTQRIISTCMKT